MSKESGVSALAHAKVHPGLMWFYCLGMHVVKKRFADRDRQALNLNTLWTPFEYVVRVTMEIDLKQLDHGVVAPTGL